MFPNNTQIYLTFKFIKKKRLNIIFSIQLCTDKCKLHTDECSFHRKFVFRFFARDYFSDINLLSHLTQLTSCEMSRREENIAREIFCASSNLIIVNTCSREINEKYIVIIVWLAVRVM